MVCSGSYADDVDRDGDSGEIWMVYEYVEKHACVLTDLTDPTQNGGNGKCG
jgi:hypothetical protein